MHENNNIDMNKNNKDSENKPNDMYPIITPEKSQKTEDILKTCGMKVINGYSIFSTSSIVKQTIELMDKFRPRFTNAFENYRHSIIQQTHSIEKLSKSIDLQKLPKNLMKIANPLSEIGNIWINNYNNISKSIKKLLNTLSKLPEFDFSKIDEAFKITCLKLLQHGYYPNRNMSLSITKINTINNSKKINDFVCQLLREQINTNKKRTISILSNHRQVVTEIFKLYDKKRYRLCILSIINLLSIIYNGNFDNIDFTESRLKDKLIALNLLDETKANYYLFAPYLFDKNSNKILANFRNNPEKYKKYPYCRNAILHGYSKRFGNQRNCLRWFSVLFNTVDLIEKFEKIKNSPVLNN